MSRFRGFLAAAAVVAAAGYIYLQNRPSRATHASPALANWAKTLHSLRWVAYSPTNWNPQKGRIPPPVSIRSDLKVLRDAGFEGLVTYGRIEGLPELAVRAKFQKMVYGIWNPTDTAELQAAKVAASDDFILGFVVGNEGLDSRYSYETLRNSIDALREATGKPVTTTEEVGDYSNPKVRELGDWLFPNVHPWYQHIPEPSLAVQWVQRRFQRLTEWTDKPVLIKEAGLPSAGGPSASESNQAAFYRILAGTEVKFVWFEAFDQPWKTHNPVEPFWGLFRADRGPKQVAIEMFPLRRK